MAVAGAEHAGTNPPARGAGRFWGGLLAGVFAVLFLMTAAGYYILNGRGFSIFIDQERLAAAVRAKVQARVSQELPIILGRMADDAAAGLAAAGGEAPRLSVQIGERHLELPGETARFLEKELHSAARASIRTVLAGFDPGPYANELAEEAYRMVQQVLAEEIYGRTFHFRANRWLTVPVTVHGN
ncbi:MAG: hypothetical protein ACM3X6_00690 [Patescibacteria group bacterium]